MFAFFDGFPEVAFGVVGVDAAHFDGFFVGELFGAVLSAEVVFDVDELAVFVDPFEGVAAEAVVEAPADGGAVVAEEHEAGVVAFGGVGEQVEEGVLV